MSQAVPRPTPPLVIPSQQPRVKLRPLFWTKVPAKPGTVWAEIIAPKTELNEQQLTVIEHLFPQAAAATPSTQQQKQGDNPFAIACPCCQGLLHSHSMLAAYVHIPSPFHWQNWAAPHACTWTVDHLSWISLTSNICTSIADVAMPCSSSHQGSQIEYLQHPHGDMQELMCKHVCR